MAKTKKVKKGRKKRRTAKQKAASLRNIKKAQAKRRKKGRKRPKKRRKARKKVTKVRRRRRKYISIRRPKRVRIRISNPKKRRKRRKRRTYVQVRGPRRVTVRVRNRRYGRKYGAGRYTIRTRNPGWKDLAVPAILGAVGMVGALIVVGKLTRGADPLLKADFLVMGEGATAVDLKPIVLPVAAGAATALLLPKYLPKYSKHIYAIGLGLIMAGAFTAINTFVIAKMAPETKEKLGLSGYVTTPFLSGYVRRVGGVGGYVRNQGLGQVEPGMRSQIPGMSASRALPPGAPYGKGMPVPMRNYDQYRFGGVYQTSSYEDL